MVFGLRSRSRKDEGYVSGINRADGNNKGANRYQTDHPPAITGLPGDNQGVNRYQTDHLPATTRAAIDRKSSSRHDQGPVRYEADHRSQDRRLVTIAPKQAHVSRKASTRRSSRMVAPTSSSEAKSTFEIERRGARTTHQNDRYGPTSFTVHKEVTVRGGSRSMHPKADHITRQFKEMIGHGASDPRSLDEIMGKAYYKGRKMSKFVRDKLDVSSRDERPLEDILDSMEREADRKGCEYCVLTTWDRNSRVDGEAYYIEVDDPQVPRNITLQRGKLMSLLC